jgi:murein DD-endopeptidase MepM/ murein hydrolase activator NlpD
MVEALAGDTPMRLLIRAGVAPEDAQAAIRTLSSVWDPRGLRAGQKAALLMQSDRLLSVRLPLAPGRDVVVARDDTGNFVAEDQERPTEWVAALGSGTIWTSLSEAANRAGVPASVVGEMIRAFSYDVDFQREIHPGDTFRVLYQRVHDEFGNATGVGRLAYGEMVLSGMQLRLYRYTTPDGETGYFNAVGENIRKPLLRTPIDGARLTSSFGMRFHPILGYSRMHRGVDFGATIGTPVFAAGDGVVSRAGRVSGYGNYIEIEHNQEYATAYGHLSGFARGLHEGARVRQGDVIGFVGMTGMATGPHLHYEVHDHGVQIDPLTVKMPALTRLAGDELKAFQDTRSAIDRALLEMRPERRDLVAATPEKNQATAAP